MIGVLVLRRDTRERDIGDVETHREEGHMGMKAETGVKLPQAKGSQEPPGAERIKKGFLPEAFGGSMATQPWLLTPDFNFRLPTENKFLLFKATNCAVFCCGSSRKLIYRSFLEPMASQPLDTGSLSPTGIFYSSLNGNGRQ